LKQHVLSHPEYGTHSQAGHLARATHQHISLSEGYCQMHVISGNHLIVSCLNRHKN